MENLTTSYRSSVATAVNEKNPAANVTEQSSAAEMAAAIQSIKTSAGSKKEVEDMLSLLDSDATALEDHDGVLVKDKGGTFATRTLGKLWDWIVSHLGGGGTRRSCIRQRHSGYLLQGL